MHDTNCYPSYGATIRPDANSRGWMVQASRCRQTLVTTAEAARRHLGVLEFPRRSDFKTVLSFDGGGLRGLVPGACCSFAATAHLALAWITDSALSQVSPTTRAAALLEGVEDAIKKHVRSYAAALS